MQKGEIFIGWSGYSKIKQILKHKHDWHHLGFFEQSEWKTKYFGIDKERFKMVLWK